MVLHFFGFSGGIPKPNTEDSFVYYIIPTDVMAKNVIKAHNLWLATPGKKGQPHKDNTVRTVPIPPKLSFSGWSIEEFQNRWDLIETHLRHKPKHTDAPATDAPS